MTEEQIEGTKRSATFTMDEENESLLQEEFEVLYANYIMTNVNECFTLEILTNIQDVRKIVESDIIKLAEAIKSGRTYDV